MRSLLGYHPGQRVEARVKFLGDGSAAAEFRDRIRAMETLPATMAKAASLGLAALSDSTQDGMVTVVLGWCEVAVLAPDGFDFEQCARRDS